jgi:hypothetical protein
MTDIVERLLKQAEDDLDPGNALVREAVAEIEQWRSRFEKLQAVAFSRAAEIERLRGIEQFVAEAARHERDGLRAEIARLRAALADTSHARTCATLMQGMAYGPCDCGRAALEPKPPSPIGAWLQNDEEEPKP